MRFRTILGLTAVLCLLLTPASHAGDFSLFGTYYDTDDYDEAVGVGGRVAFFDAVQLELAASYFDEFGSDFSFDLDDLGIQVVELDLEVIPIDAGLRFNFGSSPLYLAGGGTYFLLASDSGSVDDEFGYYARLGAQWDHLFLEGGYRDVDGTIESIDLDELGANDSVAFDLTGWFASLGWRF